MNDKILIIYAHPETKKSHNQEILNNVLKKLDSRKIDYKIFDLYRMKFNPVLKKEELSKNHVLEKEIINIQKEIKKRNKLIFIYPIWWGNMPSILKGFCDRVFTRDFAYIYRNSIPQGLLKGKKAYIFATSGAPDIYNFFTCNKFTKGLKKDVLSFCGIKTKNYIFGNSLNLEKNRKKIKEKIYKKLDGFL